MMLIMWSMSLSESVKPDLCPAGCLLVAIVSAVPQQGNVDTVGRPEESSVGSRAVVLRLLIHIQMLVEVEY